jgi:alkanesulfonate monooxygenase SsuD/methylene tetrahydromethanopterin reductase-like flavin-dependent oxidoreductase (luciferase family)
VAVWAICAEDEEEARRLAASGRMTFTLLRRGQLIAVPPPDEALKFLEQDDRSGQPRSERRSVLGSPAGVRAQIEEVVASYGAEEAIVVSITYDHEARRRSYELLAEAFEL